MILASEGFYAGVATVAFDGSMKRLVAAKRKHLREYGGGGHARRKYGMPWLEKPARNQNGAHPKISAIFCSAHLRGRPTLLMKIFLTQLDRPVLEI